MVWHHMSETYEQYVTSGLPQAHGNTLRQQQPVAYKLCVSTNCCCIRSWDILQYWEIRSIAALRKVLDGLFIDCRSSADSDVLPVGLQPHTPHSRHHSSRTAAALHRHSIVFATCMGTRRHPQLVQRHGDVSTRGGGIHQHKFHSL